MKNILLPLAFLFTISSAFAQGLPEFEELDTDADGMLSPDELSGYENIDFATVDADADGMVSAAEYEVLTEK